MMARFRPWQPLWLIALCLLAGHVLIAAAPNDSTEKATPSTATPAIKPSTTAKQATPSTPSAEKKDDVKSDDDYFELYKSLADTIDQVERNYVKPIDRHELMEAAIKGILTKLDPYSSYIDSDEMGSFRTEVEHQFGGIGIQVTLDEIGQLKVSSPLVGTPAYKAGVLAGDRIIKIEGTPTKDMSLEQAVKRLKGDVGTSVTFTVEHPLSSTTETFTIRREMVHVDTVMGDTRKPDDSWQFMLDPNKRIGYIRISMFSRDTAADLQRALEELQHEKMRGLILDLRFNPGGLLTSAVDVCKLFLDEGRIVSIHGRNTPEQDWDVTEPGPFQGFPIAVLVNHFSASASEIVSACLQDHHRAVVIGERTWGKGSVQNLIELEDGKSALKLTTATYTRPNGHNIHRFPDSKESDEWGVKPDEGMEVKLDEVEMSMLLADRHRHEMVLGKSHDSAASQALAAAGIDDSHNGATDSANSDEQKSKADASEHSSSSAPADKRASGDTASNSKSATNRKSGKVADRQLQKALDYLNGELEHK